MRRGDLTVATLLLLAGSGVGCAVPAEPAVGSTRVRSADGMTVVYVPASTFRMGSDYLQTPYARELCRQYADGNSVAACQAANYGDESPSHDVTLQGFWIDQTEVTNGEYQKCVLEGACTAPAQSGSHYRWTHY